MRPKWTDCRYLGMLPFSASLSYILFPVILLYKNQYQFQNNEIKQININQILNSNSISNHTHLRAQRNLFFVIVIIELNFYYGIYYNTYTYKVLKKKKLYLSLSSFILVCEGLEKKTNLFHEKKKKIHKVRETIERFFIYFNL